MNGFKFYSERYYEILVIAKDLLFNKVVYMFEYPGYGQSAHCGPAIPDSTSKAAKIMFNKLNSQYKGNVVFMAYSIGTGVAIRIISLGVTLHIITGAGHDDMLTSDTAALIRTFYELYIMYILHNSYRKLRTVSSAASSIGINAGISLGLILNDGVFHICQQLVCLTRRSEKQRGRFFCIWYCRSLV